MRVHFICRGNVLRSLIAETYLKSLRLSDVRAMSSGTIVYLNGTAEQEYFLNTMKLLRSHGIEAYAKPSPEQLTQKRVDKQDINIYMNQIVIDEAKAQVILSDPVTNWDITDIGEGDRLDSLGKRQDFEEEIYKEIVHKVDELVATRLT